MINLSKCKYLYLQFVQMWCFNMCEQSLIITVALRKSYTVFSGVCARVCFCSRTWRIQVLNDFQHTELLYTAKQLHNSNIRQSQDNEIPEMKSLLALRCCFFFAEILWHCVCGSALVQTWMKADCTLLPLERESVWLELYWGNHGRIIRWKNSCQHTHTWAFNCGHQTHKTEV